MHHRVDATWPAAAAFPGVGTAMGELPPTPISANAPFTRMPKNSPYMPSSPPPPKPKPPRGPAERFGRGDVMECEACGYVFVLAGKHGACRRCKKDNLVKWRGNS